MTRQIKGRGPQKLTPRQEDALAFVRTADDRWREAKLNAQIELRKLVQERVDMHAAVRDQAVYDAINLGVAKSRITQDGLRTSPNAVYEILERMNQKLELTNVELAVRPTDPYAWSEKFVAPNGYPFWFLIIEGDDHITSAQDPIPEHAGYPYVNFGNGEWSWLPGSKPNADAVAWAEENKPE